MGITAFSQTIYRPGTELSFTGASNYCVGSTISPLTYTYNTCNTGTGTATGVSATITWYYNTTNTNLISGGTTLAFGPLPYTVPTTPTDVKSFTPVLPVGGDYYFFCVIRWSGGGCSSVTDTLASSTQFIQVTPSPITPTGVLNVCVGSTITLSNPVPGGTWTSFNPGVASVNTSTGVVSGISAGAVFITYSVGSCYVTSLVNSNDTPTAITPNPLTRCEGTVTSLGSSPAGGTWISSNTSVANVDIATGVMTAGIAGTAIVTYTAPTTGCFTTRFVSINPNPAAITGSTAVCISGTTTLSNASPSGVWFSSNISIPVNPVTGVVTGSAVGTTTISYRYPSTGCMATTVVTVNNPPGTISGPSIVCAGSSITMTNPVPGGTWSSGNVSIATAVSATGVINGVSDGIVNISYTTGGCPAVSRALTVNPLPGTIVGILSTCYGSSTTLTSTVSGGRWYSDNPTIASIDSVTGIVSGHTLGTAVITYRVVSGCMTMANVTVNPLAPILGSDSVCVGSEINLTNIVGGGTWVSSNPIIASIDTFTGLVRGLVNGITYIGYTLPTGCAATFFLEVIPSLPPIAGPVEVCSSYDVVLSNGVPGGRWSTANFYVADIDSITGRMFGHFPDTTTITYTRFGCIAKRQVTVNPLPDVEIAFDWTTGKLSTLPIYATYQWYDSVSGPIPGATNSSLTLAPVQKTYYLRATDLKGCAANSDYFRLPLSVADVNVGAMCNIFPNPASSIVNIDAPINVSVLVSAIDGRVVLEATDAKQIDISNLMPGMYVIGLYDREGILITIRKLTKQ